MKFKNQTTKALQILSINQNELLFKCKNILYEWAEGIKEFFPRFEYEILIDRKSIKLIEIFNDNKRELILTKPMQSFGILLNQLPFYSEKEIKNYLFQHLKKHLSSWQSRYTK